LGASAIVSLAAGPAATEQLQRAEVIGSTRAGRLRLAFHLNNTAADADRAAEALSGRDFPDLN
jgi:selenocysteine lyase/cysteine desulfurase